jgi:ankyrin repeat protein
MTRQLDAIDELLRRGADINAERMDGGRPIHLTNGDYFYRGWRDVPRNWPVTPAQVMAHLKERGAIIDLPTACHTGDIGRVRDLLLQDRSLANKVGAREGCYLGAGAPLSTRPRPDGRTSCGCFSIAALTPIYPKLLEAGADLTARDEHLRSTPLAWAAKYGQLEMVEFLLQRGAAKSLADDPPWATPLAWAIKRGHEKIASLLT